MPGYLPKPPFPILNRRHPLAAGMIACVPAHEGSGAPYDIVRHEALTVVGSASGWGSGAYGRTLAHTSAQTNARWAYTSSGWLPTTSCTVLMIKRKTDTTNRASAAFGMQENIAAAASKRLGVHLPYSDGTVYFDFGGSTGNNRLSVAGLTFGDDVWAFRAGTLGMSIWQNGIRRGNKTTAITRVNVSELEFAIGNGNTGDVDGYDQASDIAQFPLFMMWNREIGDAEILNISADPFAVVRPERRIWYVAGAAPSGANIPAIMANYRRRRAG